MMYLFNLRVSIQILNDFQRIFYLTFHTKRKGFQSL